MKEMKKILAFFLCFVMVLGFVPATAFAAYADEAETAAETQTNTALYNALAEAKSFIDALTINSKENDPATVVSTWGKQFSWDNEKRESAKKDYLFEWSYYNGVVFEGLDYVAEVTGDTAYSDYVAEYLAAMIPSTTSTTWSKTTNDTSKDAAGYVSTHGVDCYKTASLLLDYGYENMAKQLYGHLQGYQGTYTDSDKGGNYWHSWIKGNAPDYIVWLDGLYMVQPFMAEYAASHNDTTELDRIAARFAWIGENMYNEGTGLYYHMANSSKSYNNYNNQYWGRAIGWYAAAMVDVMDHMSGDNLAAMKTQFKTLVDGMLRYQDSTTGMWRQFVNVSSSSIETSVTSLMTYAIMKAVNYGWLDSSYAQYALKAFVGMANNALDASGLHYICFKGSNNSYTAVSKDTYVNEGKGVGPFIMAYAEMLEYGMKLDHITITAPTKTEYEVGEELDLTGLTVTGYNRLGQEVPVTGGYTVSAVDMTTAGTKTVTVTYYGCTASFEITVKEAPTEPAEPEIEGEVKDEEHNVTVKADGVTSVEATPVASADVEEQVSNLFVMDEAKLVAFDIVVEGHEEGRPAEVTIPMPVGVDASRFCVFYVGEDTLEPMNGHPNEDGTYTFITTHFSTYVGGVLNDNATVEGDVVFGTYTLSSSLTKKATIASGNQVIIGDGTNFIKLNANGTYGVTTVPTEATVWTVGGSDNSWTFSNNGTTLTINGYSTWRYSGDRGVYRGNSSSRVYLRYTGGNWTTGSNSSNGVSPAYDVPSASGTYKFSASPKNIALKTGATEEIIYTVTLNDEEVTFRASDVTWATSNRNIATVSNGVVTAVAEGETTITATLNRINGSSFGGTIVLTFNVTVRNKSVVPGSEVLSGNSQIEVNLNETPDYSNIKYTITYDDNSTDVFTVGNGLTVGACNTTTSGKKTVDIFYNNEKVGEVVVNVTVDFSKLDPAETYPEYPEDGAVRIDKTATELYFENTGVVQVELDVAGVSVKPGVDAVLTIDVSNSMAWEVGTKTDNWESNKLTEVMKSVVDFATIFLAPNEDGTPTKNTISIVIFAGKDSDHWAGASTDANIDSVRTLVTATRSMDVIDSITKNTKFTGSPYKLQVAYIPENADQNNADNVVIDDAGANRGDTNYDYAFWQTEQTVDKILTANMNSTEAREVHVLFMTDGCASNFNGIYYRTSNADVAYKPGTEDPYVGRSSSSGTDWTTHIMNTLIAQNKGNTYAKSLYEKINGMYAVGFDMVNGGFSGITNWDSTVKWDVVFNDILKNVVQDDEGNGMINVTDAANTYVLNQFYKSLAQELRYAGTAAQATDTIGSKFTLQMGATSGAIVVDEETGVESGVITNLADYNITPSITIKTYDLWTKAETNDHDKIGTRKGTSQDIEVVTFNADGTEAYSNVIGAGVNIMTTTSDGTVVIAAKYFTYTKDTAGVETFEWIIGNITDKEIALAFHAYLKGSLEGQQDKGLVYTNEEAYLEYIDINGDYAKQYFPVPAVAWGGASTAYEFYLVNGEGKPCNRAGDEVPFANRIIITGPFYQDLHLNQADEYVSKTIAAAYVLPTGYTLYDETAEYIVRTASGTLEGVLTISEPAAGKVQTTKVVSAVTPSYIQSRVAFGVMYNQIPDEADFELVPDVVVIDFGLPVVVDIFQNNTKLEDGYTPTLVGFSRYNEGVDLKHKFTATSSVTPYNASYGTFTIENAVVGTARYTPTTFVDGVETVFCTVKMDRSSDSDFYYMVDKLTVIPATTVYYEDSFVHFESYSKTNDNWGKDDKTKWSIDGNAINGVQDEDRPGLTDIINDVDTNNYGYDQAYENLSTYSMGSAHKITVDANTRGEATFTFYGTGFDVIGLTSSQSGTLTVQVYEGSTATGSAKKTTIVDTYYGYTRVDGKWVVDATAANNNNAIWQVPVIKIFGLEYKQYTVKITAGWNAFFDHVNGSTSYDLFLDAVRIYDPAGKNEEAKDAYIADGEYAPKYQELRDLIIKADSFDITNSEAVSGVVFIDGAAEVGSIADYTNYGPNNEVYLAQGQAIAFQLDQTKLANVCDVQIAMKTNGGSVSYQIHNATDEGAENGLTGTLKTTTDLYYSIYDLRNGTIVITNNSTSGSILSLTNIKITYNNVASAASVEELVQIDGKSATNAVNSLAYVQMVQPSFAPDKMDILFNRTTAAIGNNVVITVTTSNDVDDLMINGQIATNKTTSYVTGETIWSFTIPVVENGTLNINIVGFDAAGQFTVPYTESVTVINMSGTQEDLLGKIFG